jgi:hypothetical protein
VKDRVVSIGAKGTSSVAERYYLGRCDEGDMWDHGFN